MKGSHLAVLAGLWLAGCAGTPAPYAPATLDPAPVPVAPSATPSQAERVAQLQARGPGPARPLVERGLTPQSAGTGFFIRPGGELLTNAHVVEACRGLTVETSNGTEALAEVVAADGAVDLAVVRAGIVSPATAVFNQRWRLDGQPVAVIGYPEQGHSRVKPFLVNGQLTGPLVGDLTRYAFKADVRHGDSGGPVLDEEGLVVGVVFAKIDTVKVYRVTGRNVQHLAFAISNDTVQTFLSAHGIVAVQATSAPKPEDLFEAARPAIARVVCWKPKG